MIPQKLLQTNVRNQKSSQFKLGFALAVFAWVMQLSVFWLPVLTGNIDYGHGVCIKLDTARHGHVHNHTHNHHNHPAQQTHHTDHIGLFVGASKASDLDKHSSNHLDGSHSDGNSHSSDNSHCDICALFAVMSGVGSGLHIMPLAVLVERVVPYRRSLKRSFFYSHPPPRAPPLFS